MQIAYLDEGWADGLVPPRDAGLLESEWMLRVVVLGDQFVSHLVSGDASLEQECGRVLDMLKTAQHPGTHTTTQEATRRDWQQVVDAWPKSTVDTSSFWALGARRSTIYEPVFGRILSDYNVGRPGFLKYRPDYVVEPFEPCSVLSASSGTTEDINRAIRRSAHVFEFTAIDRADAASVKAYLSQKLPNYVEITREQ